MIAFFLIGSVLFGATTSVAQCPALYTLSANTPSQNATTGTYTVPSGGPYRIKITARGAKGGDGYFNYGYYGCCGAIMVGEFIVNSRSKWQGG